AKAIMTTAMAMFYTHLTTPLGRLLLVSDSSGLRQINFPRNGAAAYPDPSWQEDESVFAETIVQLQGYFGGVFDRFDLVLAPAGTAFQQRVWSELCKIPYGQTISYGELARRIGNPKASRAVGLANGSNPIPIVIPCHRVIGSNGKLTGYGGGLPIKEKLLALERRQFTIR
ncbi:MAG TPA: methylated-DNA--[protein]-cysteine S-methyltransferase, partial [Terriglobales bacterium]